MAWAISYRHGTWRTLSAQAMIAGGDGENVSQFVQSGQMIGFITTRPLTGAPMIRCWFPVGKILLSLLITRLSDIKWILWRHDQAMGAVSLTDQLRAYISAQIRFLRSASMPFPSQKMTVCCFLITARTVRIILRRESIVLTARHVSIRSIRQTRVATEIWNYRKQSTFYSPFCSSVYEDSPLNYVVDYAITRTANADAAGLGKSLVWMLRE